MMLNVDKLPGKGGPENLQGIVFGKLTALTYVPGTKIAPRSRWVCICECGGSITAKAENLKRGKTKSCGCDRRANRVAQVTKHGQSGGEGRRPTGAYRSWHAMRQRCDKPSHKQYADYGGRGIKVCERWELFENFYADMGDRPDGMTLDRWPDKNGNYEPGNCRWATAKQQTQNQRRKVKNSDMLPILEAAKLVIAANDNVPQAIAGLASAVANYEQKRAA